MSEEVKCSVCGNVIGREFDIEGVVFLDCGGAIVRRMEASCKQCGRGFYWTVPDVRLERLIKRVLGGRGRYTLDE